MLGRGRVLLLLLAGCGLSLDLSPPDPQRIDAGPRADGGNLDASVRDGGVDAGRCRTDLDCDDGDACTGLELCDDGTCVPGVAVVCPDDDVCDGTFTCDPETGECSVEVGPPDCEGGDACSGVRTCDPVAGCVTLPGLTCDDGIACTDDRCEDGDCVHVPDDARCDAADGGVCAADGCVYETCDAETCRPENPCQTARCDGESCIRITRECPDGQECCGGECAPLGCDDGNACTRDVCAPMLGCRHEPSALPIACDDGDLCTTGDRCEGARCAPGTAACTTSSVCLAPVCNPSAGGCGLVFVDGILCSDGDPCTTNDRCSGGFCVGGAAPSCDDGNPCTVESCTSMGCVTTNVVDDIVCTNAGSSGTCISGRCVLSSACVDGTTDCDGDGDCECVGGCGVNMAGQRACTTTACGACGRGATCCNLIDSRDYGVCVGPETICLGGTCCLADGV
jgi:hypothetical protein